MNKRKKKLDAMLWGAVFGLLFLTFAGAALWIFTEVKPSLLVILLYVGIYVVMAACVVAAGVQRVKEIEGGEEDEARKY